jgi:hypothetical protein
MALLGVAFFGSAVASGCGGKNDGSDTKGDAAAGGASEALSSGDAAPGRVQARVDFSHSYVHVACGADASSDPVSMNADVVFDAPAGQSPDSVTFPVGRLVFGDPPLLTWNFDVMTAPIDGPAPPPPEVVETLRKVPGSGSGAGTGALCDYCDAVAEFDLEVKSPGQSPYWTGAYGIVLCNY